MKIWEVEHAEIGSEMLEALLLDGWEPFGVIPESTFNITEIVLRRIR